METLTIDLDEVNFEIGVDTLTWVELVTKKLNADVGKRDIKVRCEIEILEASVCGACGERLNNLTAKEQIKLLSAFNSSGANSNVAAAASTTSTVGELKQAIGV